MSIRSIVLKLAGRCNLNCSYCYVYNREDRGYLTRPKFISDETFDATLERIIEYCDVRPKHRMGLSFHGGEPTLIGPERFNQMAGRARETLGHRLSGMVMQTNATLLDDRWLEVIQKHQVRVGVSLDGPPEIHDAERVDHQGKGSYEKTIRGLRLLQQAGLKPGVLCVVNPSMPGLPIYRHFRDLGIRSIGFLLPDVSHDTKLQYYGGLGPTPVADYLIPIFDQWFEEDDPGVVVRVLRDLMLVLLGGSASTDSFGSGRLGYLVVETDGSIETLDALRVCEDGISKSGLTVHDHGFDQLTAGSPLVRQSLDEGFPVCAQCRACPEVSVCKGGYLPHRFSLRRGFDNPSVWCRDILALIEHIRSRTGVVRAA